MFGVIVSEVANLAGRGQFAGPGGWNYPDRSETEGRDQSAALSATPIRALPIRTLPIRAAPIALRSRSAAGTDRTVRDHGVVVSLEVGNARRGHHLTPAETRAHFALYAVTSSPLILGNDVRCVSRHSQGSAHLPPVFVLAQHADALGIWAGTCPRTTWRWSATSSRLA